MLKTHPQKRLIKDHLPNVGGLTLIKQQICDGHLFIKTLQQNLRDDHLLLTEASAKWSQWMGSCQEAVLNEGKLKERLEV